MPKLAQSPEFSDAQYAAIGRAIRAFGELEHQLAVATLDLYGGASRADTDEMIGAKGQKVASGALEMRLNLFIGTYIEQFQRDAWLDEFESQARNLIQWRNAFCHGRWVKTSSGNVQPTFYERTYVERLENPPEHELSIDNIHDLVQGTLWWTRHLQDKVVSLL